jgi:hypothetical protein
MVSLSLRQAITSIFCDFLTKSVSCSALSLLHKVLVSVLQTSYEEDGSTIPVTLLAIVSTVLSDSAESLLSFVEAGGVRFAFDQLIELKRRRDFEDGEEKLTIFDSNPSVLSAIETYTLKEQNDATSSKVTTPPHRENEEVLKNFISGCSVLNVSSNTGMECETLAGLLPDWSVTYSSWDKYFAEDEEDFYFTLALPKDIIIHKIVVTMGIPYEFSPQKIVISTGRDGSCLSPVGVFPILYQPWLEVSFPRPELARVIRFGLTRSFNRRVSLSGIKILGVTAMESLISTLSNKQPAPGSETVLPLALGSDFISLTRKVETILDLLCILLKNISKHSSATLTTSDKRVALESALTLLAQQVSSPVGCEGEGEIVSYYQQLQEMLLSFGLSSNTLKKKAVQSFVLVSICAPDCSSPALESLLSSENRDNRMFVLQCLEPLCYIPSVSGRVSNILFFLPFQEEA